MARVFISYAHADNQSEDPGKRWLDRMEQHLQPLGFAQIIKIDTDRALQPGDVWHDRLHEDLNSADAGILLVSPAFLASEYIRNNEVPILLRKAKEQGIKIIPVILRACLVAETRFKYPDPNHGPDEFTLISLQAAGSPDRALNEMTEGEQDRALLSVAQTLHRYASHSIVSITPPGYVEKSTLPRIDLTHLPAGAPHFLGREQELQQLDAAWAPNGQTAIVTIIAPGGVGKTALTKRWLDGLRAENWRGARRVYGWSFYSQGTADDRQASEDHFLAETLKWFRVDIAPNAAAADKGRALGEAIVQSRTLLILDGVEPLQYPPGPLEGRLRAPGLEALLTHLATAGQPGLCLLSSRERLADLAEYERTDQHACGPVLRLDLGNLSDHDGARLLYQQGVQRAGAAALTAEDEELQQASREVGGHALTLSLLGGYLALAYEGDILRRKEINFAEADRETKNGHAFKVMHAYEIWLEQNGSTRELAALRLLAFYDRPASPESLAALRAAPAIAGLTEALQDLTDAQWRTTLKRLQTLRLVFLPSTAGEEGIASATATTSLDAHPLIREYLAHRLQQTQPEAWREGHRRLYEFLKSSVEEHPASLAGLQPLYQAVAHGCKAGLWQEACDEMYWNRIQRGKEAYSTYKLGAFGDDLGAVTCFFSQPWQQPAPALSEADQAWLLHQVAFSLRALGRLEEALDPMRAGAEKWVQQENWAEAANGYSNLSELQLTQGRVAAAVADARTAMAYADRSGDAFQRMGFRTTLADALHQQGDAAALPLFAEAEALQREDQPQYPLLYSLASFRYCDALLAGAERAAWGLDLVGRVRHGLLRRNPTDSGGAAQSAGSPARSSGYAALTRPTALGGNAGSSGGKSFAGKPAPTAAGDDDGHKTVGWADARKPNILATENAMLGFVPQPNLPQALADCAAVAERGRKMFEWRVPGDPLLDIALDHLTLARAALYTALLQAADPSSALAHTKEAVDGLRAAGQQDDLPRGLLTRAWLAHCLGDEATARADLAEVERIARRGNMRLFLADLHLTRARLFPDEQAPTHLAQARRLIEECGYGRRLPELEDAEAWLSR